jgi:D-alanine-D-alanine ligase
MSGDTILKNIPEKYHPVDILISKEGVWHRGGMEMDPRRALSGIDVVIIAMHGEYGEDGKVQQILDRIGVPYAGSGALASAVGMNKHIAKQHFTKAGLKTPHAKLLSPLSDDAELQALARELFKSFPIPAVIKPAGAGSSVGVTIARTLAELEAGLEKAFGVGGSVLVEEFIPGVEATCGVIENFRGKDIYALFPIEIVPAAEQGFFDYEAKYAGKSQEICPGRFSHADKMEIERMAIEAHKALGLRHYSRSDFIINPKRGIYILESNTLPGMTSESLFPKAIRAVGSTLPEFIDHLISLALERK